MKIAKSQMAGLFLYAAIVQGAIAAVITLIGAFGDQIGLLPYAVARVIAGGGAGSWFVMGYVTYLIVGVIAMAVTSIFYVFIESIEGHTYKGLAKTLSWGHLVLGNIGVAGAALLAMWGGYWGAYAASKPNAPSNAAHLVLSVFQVPIAVLLGLGTLGFFLGGIGYILAIRTKA
jgi:hypothetical protein